MITLTKDGNTVRITLSTGVVVWQSVDQFMNAFTLDKGTMTVSFVSSKLTKTGIPIAQININGTSGITTEADLGAAIQDLVKLDSNVAIGLTPTLQDVLNEGNDGDGQKITNIAPGTDPSDAVIFGQLPKEFIGIIHQSSTGAPAIDSVMKNTLGGTPVFTRDGTGQYTCTLTGAFPIGKTLVKIQPRQNNDPEIYFAVAAIDVSVDFFEFFTHIFNIGLGTVTLKDGVLGAQNSYIIIQVYP